MFASRATMFRWHSWLGLATGVFMLLIAWSGSIAVFNDEIGWLVTPELRAEPARGVRSLDQVLTAMQSRFPGRRLDLHIQSGPHWAHTGYVYETGATRFVHIDPASAAITRVDTMSGYTWNAVYFIRQLHVRLLMGFWGRVFVGLFGVTLVLSIVTSLWIYRDWLRSLVRVRRGYARRIFHMDLHKIVGAWTLVINLIFGVTGAVLGLENLYNRVRPRRSAAVATPAPALPALPAGLSAGEAAAAVSRLDPEFVPTVLQYNPQNTVVVVRGDHPGVLIAKDASAYRIDLATGAVLERQDARRARWSTYLYNTLDPLHFGYFGDKWSNTASYAIKILWCVLGLTPGVLGITGGYMWWLRRQRALAAAAARDGVMVPAQSPAARNPRPGWSSLPGVIVFLAIGYSLQAVVWDRGWAMSELLWQHWIVKPVCLVAVAFPVTLLMLAAGRALWGSVGTRSARAGALLATVPLGALYLLAVSLFN